jgi:uncharacterized protein (DUF362 family)
MTTAAPRAAFIVDSPGLGGEELLKEALSRSAFREALERACGRGGLEPADLRVVIAPEWSSFQPGGPGATDPRLVEALIDLCHDGGYPSVSVVGSADSSSLWADNRDLLALADLLGYRFVTGKGRSYEILDLARDLAESDFPRGALLHGSRLGRAWLGAGFRICFAKNRSDDRDGYALCAASLIGVLPLADKDLYYRGRHEPGDVVAELLVGTPVDFALIDAVESCHGSGGSRAPRSLTTGTVIASDSLLLADWAGALKMGVDPHISRVNRRALARLGLPERVRVDGNLAPYPGWEKVHPLVSESASRLESWSAASRTVRPWLQVTDAELFPFRNPIDARLNATLSPAFANVDGDRGALTLLVGLQYLLAGIHDLLEAYRILADKDALRQREVPLGLDPTALPADAWDAVITELSALRPLLASRPADPSGLRWCDLEKAVLFEIARTIPVPFEEFTGRVDVSRTIQYMNDYIGGVAVPVAVDDRGRVTRQAERNLYLPQPNYLVLSQGDVIDVTKLECAEYGSDRHVMYWKTIRSENGSAEFDDGIVTFERLGEDTRVAIFGRQLFRLPPFWEAVNLDRFPTLKGELVVHAYTTFFDRTFANLEAVVEGREIRIGRPWADPPTPSESEPRPVDVWGERLTRLADRYGGLLKGDLLAAAPGRSGPAPLRIDEHGFRHFAPADGRAATSGGVTPSDDVRERLARFVSEGLAAFGRDLEEALRLDAAGTTAPGAPDAA